MKYVVIIPDGMADRPMPELDGKTPMQVAKKPNMDALARHGVVGSVQTIPEGMPAGSDVAIMSLMGYDPRGIYTGRGPLEAAAIGVDLDKRDIAFRCNLLTSDGETMIDYSGGHITTPEARVLMEEIGRRLGTRTIHFYPGVSYRHLLVWRDGSEQVKCVPPHDITGQPIEPNLPVGDGDSRLREMIFDSMEILNAHELNKRRVDAGKNPANMIWPWTPGRAPHIESYAARFGVTGAVITAVDLIRGLGKYTGLRVIEVPGATGYLDTNYRGKADYAIEALRELDFVLVHVEAPDEMGHEGRLAEKIEAIERIDADVVGPIVEALRRFDEPSRILISPDHRTPLAIKTHSREPVPFVVFDMRNEDRTQSLPYDERAIDETDLRIDEGHELMGLFLGDKI